MQYDRGRKIRLGLFILFGTALFVAFFYLIGISSQLFSKTATLHTRVRSVSGLHSGDHVRFSGIIIGTVGELMIISDTAVQVDISVDRKMLKFIRKDSKVEIKPEALIGKLEELIYFLDEPQADPAPINAMFIAERAREDGIKVLLSGAGGDDIFTGYRRHSALIFEKYWTWLPSLLRRCLARGIGGLGYEHNNYIRRLKKACAKP